MHLSCEEPKTASREQCELQGPMVGPNIWIYKMKDLLLACYGCKGQEIWVKSDGMAVSAK